MAAVRVLLLRAPGTNCDRETGWAFEVAGGQPTALHVQRLLEQPQLLDDYQILCLPGGFSYGDDIAAGRILGGQLRHHLGDVLRRFRDSGKLILGICNGFQILLRSGLLLEEDAQRGPAATLALNASGKFEDRWVQLQVAAGNCVFLNGIQSMYLPVAHAEGRFVLRDQAVQQALGTAGQLVLRYTQPGKSEPTEAYPANPNGAAGGIAGVCDPTGRVFGLMPHPERHIDPTQHPRWTRRADSADVGEGLAVFRNAVHYFQ